MNKKIIVAALAGILLFGAGVAIAEEMRIVDWYLAAENKNYRVPFNMAPEFDDLSQESMRG